jgi:co-chaperonin GroES (HSP10)
MKKGKQNQQLKRRDKIVLYGKYAETEISVEGKDYLLLCVKVILLII